MEDVGALSNLHSRPRKGGRASDAEANPRLEFWQLFPMLAARGRQSGDEFATFVGGHLAASSEGADAVLRLAGARLGCAAAVPAHGRSVLARRRADRAHLASRRIALVLALLRSWGIEARAVG